MGKGEVTSFFDVGGGGSLLVDIPNDDVSVLPNVFLRSGFGNIAVRVQAMVEPSSGNPHFIVATEFNYPGVVHVF